MKFVHNDKKKDSYQVWLTFLCSYQRAVQKNPIIRKRNTTIYNYWAAIIVILNGLTTDAETQLHQRQNTAFATLSSIRLSENNNIDMQIFSPLTNKLLKEQLKFQ